MDLAEIRKKARQKPPEAGRSAVPETVDSLSQETLVPASLESGAVEVTTALESYFPDLNFASEEEYIQGLSGAEKRLQGESTQWLTFLLGEEEYALTLDVIHELIRPRDYTELPDVPEHVRGILSLRGEVVPVVDLMARLRLGQGTDSSYQRIVVCEGPDQLIGLLVDRITQVIRIAKDSIEPTPLVLKDRDNSVSGVGRYDGRMLILLDPEEVLKI